MRLDEIKKIDNKLKEIKDRTNELEDKISEKIINIVAKKENKKNCILFIIGLGISFVLFSLIGLTTNVLEIVNNSNVMIFALEVNIFLFFGIIFVLGAIVAYLIKFFLLNEYFKMIAKNSAEKSLHKRRILYKYSSNADKIRLEKLYDKLEHLNSLKQDLKDGKIRKTGSTNLADEFDFRKTRNKSIKDISVLPDEEE